MSQSITAHVGLDVHKDSIDIALAPAPRWERGAATVIEGNPRQRYWRPRTWQPQTLERGSPATNT